jgi:hypothetical protein
LDSIFGFNAMKKTGWHRPFEDPIPLPNGRKLHILMDAGEYIQSLSKSTHDERAWQNAAEALLLVVNQNGPTMFARIGMMRALYQRGELVFNRERKETHWGKRKLKRDERKWPPTEAALF